MKVSDRGLAEIAGHEGIVLKRYKDSVGVWTIGIGHTVSAGDPDPSKVTQALSLPEAMEIFRRDIAKFERRVNAAVMVPLLQHEFDALVSFDFNTGGIYRAKLTSGLNAGNKNAAANGFMGWVKPPEIRKRRTAEMNLFKFGNYDDGHATIFDASSTGKVLWSISRRVDVLSQIIAESKTVAKEPIPPKKPPSAPPPQAQTFWTTFAAFIGRFFIRR